MRKIKEGLRLHHEAKLSRRAISHALSVSYGSVANYLNHDCNSGKVSVFLANENVLKNRL